MTKWNYNKLDIPNTVGAKIQLLVGESVFDAVVKKDSVGCHCLYSEGLKVNLSEVVAWKFGK